MSELIMNIEFQKSKPCFCDECIENCKKRPGWFLPGEAERAAKYLKISISELFKKYLVVDYWYDSGDGDINILCPGSKEEHGRRASWGFPFNSKCIFLTNKNRCLIHPVKPFECAVVIHTRYIEGLHEWISKQWKDKNAWRMVEEASDENNNS